MKGVCWVLWLGPLVYSQSLEILDPVNDALVSGDYEMVLRTDQAEAVVRTEVLINDVVVFNEEGWQPTPTVDFGEDFTRQIVQARIAMSDGSAVLSDPLRTRELKVFYEETSRLILVSAIVRSRFNRPVELLSQEDFRVFEGRQELEIATFNSEQVPLDLVLMLDTSSSLRGAMDTLKTAASAFLDKLQQVDRVALYSFANESDHVMGFTNDRKLMRKHIDAFEAYGETALFDTLLLSLDAISQRNRGRRAIVLFTDGRDSVYEEPREKARFFRDAVNQAQKNEVVVFTIGLGKRINEDALTALSEETGGRYYHADGFADLSDRFAQVLADLRNQYLLGVIPASNQPGFHELEIKVKKMGAKVYARKGYTID